MSLEFTEVPHCEQKNDVFDAFEVQHFQSYSDQGNLGALGVGTARKGIRGCLEAHEEVLWNPQGFHGSSKDPPGTPGTRQGTPKDAQWSPQALPRPHEAPPKTA